LENYVWVILDTGHLESTQHFADAGKVFRLAIW